MLIHKDNNASYHKAYMLEYYLYMLEALHFSEP